MLYNVYKFISLYRQAPLAALSIPEHMVPAVAAPFKMGRNPGRTNYALVHQKCHMANSTQTIVSPLATAQVYYVAQICFCVTGSGFQLRAILCGRIASKWGDRLKGTGGSLWKGIFLAVWVMVTPLWWTLPTIEIYCPLLWRLQLLWNVQQYQRFFSIIKTFFLNSNVVLYDICDI